MKEDERQNDMRVFYLGLTTTQAYSAAVKEDLYVGASA